MEILVVNNQLQLGGAETVIHQLRSRLSNVRVMVTETSDRTAEVMYPRFLSRLSHTRIHDLVETICPIFAWTNNRIARLRNDPADIIHIHNFHGQYASIETLARLIAAKPVVWTFHGLWGVTGGCDHSRGCQGYLNHCGQCPQLGLWPIGNIDRTADQLLRKIGAFADLPINVIAPSKYFYDTIRSSRVGKNWNVYHIPNGVDATRFVPRQQKSRRLRVLIVNRNFQDPHKGFQIAAEVLNLLDSPDVELTFAGLNSNWAISQIKRSYHTRDAGYISDRRTMAELYAESHILLFASPAENFPCVVLEAMASGCCVVATPSGGVVEQISDGETGFLASEISGTALAIALNRTLEAPEAISDIGSNARRRVIECFSEDAMVGAHLQLYESILGRSRRAGPD